MVAFETIEEAKDSVGVGKLSLLLDGGHRHLEPVHKDPLDVGVLEGKELFEPEDPWESPKDDLVRVRLVEAEGLGHGEQTLSAHPVQRECERPGHREPWPAPDPNHTVCDLMIIG